MAFAIVLNGPYGLVSSVIWSATSCGHTPSICVNRNDTDLKGFVFEKARNGEEVMT